MELNSSTSNVPAKNRPQMKETEIVEEEVANVPTQNRCQMEEPEIVEEEVVNNGAAEHHVPAQNKPQMGETVHAHALNNIQFQVAEKGDFMAELQDSEVKMWLHHKRCKADRRIEDVNDRCRRRIKKLNDEMTKIVAQLDLCKEAYVEDGRQNHSISKERISSLDAKRGRYIDRMQRKMDVIGKEAEKSRMKIELKFNQHIMEGKLREAKKEFLKKYAEIRINQKVQLDRGKAQVATLSAEIKAIKVAKRQNNVCDLWCCGDFLWINLFSTRVG